MHVFGARARPVSFKKDGNRAKIEKGGETSLIRFFKRNKTH